MTALANSGFSLASWGLIAVGFAYRVSGSQMALLWYAAAFGVLLVGAVAADEQLAASIAAVFIAAEIWKWWNGGGGDDTRRRLSKWGRRFRGVRRTAPVGGTA